VGTRGSCSFIASASPDIDILLIGGSDEGDLIGMWTVSIET
jgi:hypothetical protein